MRNAKRTSLHHWAAIVSTASLVLGAGAGLAAAPAPAPSSVWEQLTTDPASISVSVQNPTVGQTEGLTAQGLPSGAKVNLIWETVIGHWKVNGPSFIGAQYHEGTEVLAHLEANREGDLTAHFQIPEGFGGEHLLGLQLASGKMAGVSSVTIIPSVSLASSKVAQGGFFQFTMHGIGYQPYFAQFPVLYDNRVTGNVTAVDTEGTAHFSIRAEGVGANEIVINNGTMGGPYLNEQQSPFPYMPNFSFPVTVLPGTPQDVSNPLPTLSAPKGRYLTASVGSGVVGSAYTLIGHGLKPNHRYSLTWWTTKGSHVSGNGYSALAVPMGTVVTNKAGAFRLPETVPSDLGGPAHKITLSNQGKVISATSFRIFPKVIAISPNPAPEGSLVTVTLLGGGWTDYDNIYAVDYDNGYVGFGCAFNSQGNLQIQFRATGKPGIHFIDLYPSIWKGKQTLPNPYLLPQLTYNADHPGDWLPAFHLVLKVTAPTS
ncbi:MAG: hypothetical protein M1600_11165 [Firmicutes bacterium]|nr:hypothetical protein [Bacillota bacterium]